MSSITIDLEVRVFDGQDYVPFDQVMELIRNLNKHTPNVDLEHIAKGLEKQRDQIRQNQ